MNILPKKKWHVRTKENMARVRRDEAQAAEEEKKILDRQILAENECRLQALRKNADKRMENAFGVRPDTTDDVMISEQSGHVNLFQDLEREEQKNIGVGNKDYEKEKKKEQQEWDSKLGIQKAFAEGTNERDKKKEWYEILPARRGLKQETTTAILPNTIETKETIVEREKKKKKKRKRSPSSSHSSSDDDSRNRRKHKKSKKKKKRRKEEVSDDDIEKEEKKRLIAALREERLQRERTERARTMKLLNPQAAAMAEAAKSSVKKPKYNSQFNPEFSRN